MKRSRGWIGMLTRLLLGSRFRGARSRRRVLYLKGFSMALHKHKKDVYEKCKAAGICTKCKKRPGATRPGRAPLVNCEECAASLKVGAKERSAKRTNRLLALGLCLVCGKRPARKDRKTCQGCKEKVTKRARETRPKLEGARMAKGLCRLCGVRPQLGSMTTHKVPMCEMCFYKACSHRALGNRRLWETLKNILAAQNYKCAYTGRRLTLGVNASVDHILPVARFPHLKSDPNNIQWVDKSINFMKNDFLTEEFLGLVKEIAAHRL